MKSLDIVKTIYFELFERKAEDIIVLDMRKVSVIADYFVLSSINSVRGVKSLSDFTSKKLKDELNIHPKIEGLREGRWIILDVGDIFVHIYHSETREYFQLESLWKDAKNISIKK